MKKKKFIWNGIGLLKHGGRYYSPGDEIEATSEEELRHLIPYIKIQELFIEKKESKESKETKSKKESK